MRQACQQAIFELAKTDDRVFFVGSDLGVGTLDDYKAELPERFLMEGISEANIVGLSAGLAIEGKIPYVVTIATFMTRRCYEQIAVDVCLHNLKVRFVGQGAGYVYAPLGPTHQAIEDIAICRALPNMTIICPADADEMNRLMPQTLDWPGPIYIRVAKGYDEIVSSDDRPTVIGKAIRMREGSDALIITTGITRQRAIQAVEILQRDGISTGILHVHTPKPLDEEAILDAVKSVDSVITYEEHNIIGGLGSAVAELLAEAELDNHPRFKRIGIPDVFADEYGSQDSIMDNMGMSVSAVVDTVTAMTRRGSAKTTA